MNFTSNTLNEPDMQTPGAHASQAEHIYQTLLRAVMEHRLPAGTKLGEERLSELTGAGRSRVRQVLSRLAHDNLVTLIPNRGAFVASPSREEAAHVFQTRRFVEPELAASLAGVATVAMVTRLKQHLQQEERARADGDRAAMIRLSGEFHVRIAEMVGNPILVKLVTEMVSRTCLIITLYDRPLAQSCPEHEHSALVKALQQKNAARARDIMSTHLMHIERSLDLNAVQRQAVALEALFQPPRPAAGEQASKKVR
jgi:DNA-binding GntR family transcriptional regulator